MDFTIISSSFLLLFLAEMGDKSQLLAMTLAHRYRLLPVISGVFAAFLLLNLLAVLLGDVLFQFVPQRVVLLGAGLLFLLFAWRSWLEADEVDDDEADQPRGGRDAFLSSFALIFVAELGDKTQLAMVALVAGSGQAWSVFVGGTAALWTVSLLGIVVGSTLLRRVPKAWMHRIAALLFLVFAVLAIAQVLLGGGIWRQETGRVGVRHALPLPHRLSTVHRVTRPSQSHLSSTIDGMIGDWQPTNRHPGIIVAHHRKDSRPAYRTNDDTKRV